MASSLHVKPSGICTWRLNYRHHDVQRTINFGRYPELLLAEARERLLKARCLIRDDIGPVNDRKQPAMFEKLKDAQLHRLPR